MSANQRNELRLSKPWCRGDLVMKDGKITEYQTKNLVDFASGRVSYISAMALKWIYSEYQNINTKMYGQEED